MKVTLSYFLFSFTEVLGMSIEDKQKIKMTFVGMDFLLLLSQIKLPVYYLLYLLDSFFI